MITKNKITEIFCITDDFLIKNNKIFTREN
jgi:hypothetical protein